ncbi:Glutamyl-tRNA(Gln) amidotransferase subunit A [Austwickia sp. TVS 96-490-7B]|uniref:Asp-tRNA(Asn)/Glu-tRNA(Gln) amidotransferase subunit GatA n=1 Tax=Austwickia sp. TVS 96-490-7B TaxID=2830843 RepID=UPI001C55F1DF|nr:Asp-tRNA(Asn)/Glu-tRNA(Gln) amidotransferase subunit GatA [Austwickia sp. TVS 96-490-7B]MBW3085847.1 Glutamyl-tRNA(Gln) amidotransferase subunit A [Austwickia sp. TVS 96-490-7B]
MTTSTDLTRQSAARLAELLAAGEVSSQEVTAAHLERMRSVDGAVHAYLHHNDDQAMAVARDVDQARRRGDALPVLAGVPVAVKDVACTIGQPTTAGSRILQGWEPPYDATIVTRLRAAGMPILGKTNMDEFAMGSSTEHSGYGPTGNPWDLRRVPGGSGGGSAAVLASFTAPLAVGSDTGGSIRQPAALTGTVGAKPTYGGISRYGIIALASSLDQIGPCGRTVLDTALLHDVMAGHDPRDSTSIDAPVPPVVAAARRGDVAGMKVGVIRQLSGAGYQPGVRARFDEAVTLLSELGAQVIDVDCPHLDYALGAYYLIMMSEASSNLARYDAMRYGLRVAPDGVAVPSAEQVTAASRGAGFGAEAKRRIILGTYALSSGYYDAYYGQAQKVRTLIARDFAAAFAQVDVLISPTAPTTAWELGAKVEDPMAMYLGDVATIPSNLAGIPGISVPVGLADEDGLPVGLQVLAPAMADDRLYNVAAAVEKALVAQWGGPLSDRVPDLTAAVPTATTSTVQES